MQDEFIEMIAGNERDPDVWRESLARFAEKTAMGPHDVSMVAIDDDGIELEMPMGDHARQIAGLLHGGVSMMLAESAASIHACWGVELTEKFPVGIEIGASHLEPATEGTIRAVATVVRRGETHIVHRVEIRHHEQNRLLSECRVTNYYRRPSGD